MPDALLEQAARLCMSLGTDGLRGELTLLRTARALAALDGAATVTEEHLIRIAPPALRHRLRRNPLDDAGSTTRVERAIAEMRAAGASAAAAPAGTPGGLAAVPDARPGIRAA